MKTKHMKGLYNIKRFRISGSQYLDAGVINGSFALKSKGPLVRTFARMLRAIGLGTTKFRISVIVHLVRRFSDIHREQGMKGLIVFLKANTVLVQQSLAGFRLRDLTPLGPRVSRTNQGLPRIIIGQDRASIRAGNFDLMRFYLTVLNLYRVLEMPGKLKLNTITDGFKGEAGLRDLFREINSLVPEFSKMILNLAGDKLESRGIDPSPILKSAPGASGGSISTNPLVLIRSARNLRTSGLLEPLLYFAKKFQPATKVRYPGFTRILLEAADSNVDIPLPSTIYPMGKLGFKQEAAGKVRVFAMVDAWTQWVLEPLHLEIFRILKYLPMDGTFDQLAPIRKYQDWPSAYSLDLSAATDRLPISLQINLLSSLYGMEFALNWARLLVGRPYSYYYKPTDTAGVVEYAVGQPMGALSSWAMLALTHHAIVQFAAWTSGVTPVGTLWRNYALLGDDIVIGDRRVKDRYLLILRALGVECGLAKSVLSTRARGIEFAKRTLIDGVDVSPFPLSEFFSACRSLPSALAVAQKYKLTLPQLVKLLGYGYEVLGGLNKHVGLLNARVRALILGYNIPVLKENGNAQAAAFLATGNPVKKLTDPSVVAAFSTIVLMWISAEISGKFKFHLGTWIKDVVVQLRGKLLHAASHAYLMKISDYRNLSEVAIALPTGRPKRGGWAPIPKSGEVTLPPDVYNRIETDVRGLDLLLTNLLSMLIGSAFEKERDLLFKLKSDLNKLQYSRDVGDAFNLALEATRDINDLPAVSLSFKRVDDEGRGNILDIKQIKLWRLWSEILLLALRSTDGEGRIHGRRYIESIAVVMARNAPGTPRSKAEWEQEAMRVIGVFDRPGSPRSHHRN